MSESGESPSQEQSQSSNTEEKRISPSRIGELKASINTHIVENLRQLGRDPHKILERLSQRRHSEDPDEREDAIIQKRMLINQAGSDIRNEQIDIKDAERAFAVTTAKQLSHERDTYKLQAETSEITGLSTKKVYDRKLNEAVERASLGQTVGNVVIVDLDLNGLGAMNDMFGHSAGDALLKGVASALEEGQRIDEPPYQISNEYYSDSTETHIHGDEFAVVLDNVKDVTHIKDGQEMTLSGTQVWADRKKAAFKNQHITLDGKEIANGISIGGGYAEIRPTEVIGKSKEEIDKIVQRKKDQADLALYAAKYLSKQENKALRDQGLPENSVVFLSFDELRQLDPSMLNEIEQYRIQKATEKKDK